MKNKFISVFIVMTSVLLHAQPARQERPGKAGTQYDSIMVEIKNMGQQINSTFIDYAPLISADASLMIFTSRKPLSENKTRNFKDHIYYSNFDSKKMKWSDAIPLSYTINNPERNNSAISISNDGQQMLIYRDDLNTNGDIYESHVLGADWTEPVNLGEPINSGDKEPSACISPDGGTIYFVSDRKGGLGGFDIWYCIKNSDGNWGEAINIGKPVNSAEDEDGLFFHPDGKTLFFSSKGHHSLGGYDVFMSVLDQTTKVGTMPKNLGPSINTSGDDLYFVMEANGKIGYYSSNRLGGFGEKDIYRITFLEDIMNVNLTLLKGRVMDEKGNSIESKIVVKDKSTSKIIGIFSSDSATGKYLISLPASKNYEMEVTADSYIKHIDSIDISDKVAYTEITKDIVLKSIKLPQGLQDSIVATVATIDSSTISSTDETNAKIATSVKVTKGDLNPTIYGRVLDENGNPIKVQIEVIDNNTDRVVAKYQTAISTGIFSLRLKGGNYRFLFSKPCYLFQSVFVTSSNTPGYKKDLKDIKMEKVGVGKKIVLDNIFFDYTKAMLREESYSTLDRTIRLMNSLESLEIEISGHTDSISSAEYNQVLSEERARAVMKYLVRMGIDEERLKYKGYGFSQPIATNETEEGRQLNRRTELKVLNMDLEAEQIKEVKHLKEFIIAQAKLNPDNNNLAIGKESKNNISVPDRFKQFNTDINGKISYTEIMPAIDSFLEGTQHLNAEEIVALIDYYFEQ